MKKAKYDYSNLNSVTIEKAIYTYLRTDSGKSWKTKPESVERETVSAEFYKNYVESIPFFNNWGNGASCKAQLGYTKAGKLPVKVITVSPMRKEMIVAVFNFM